MSNRTALIKIIADMDVLDARMRDIAADVSSMDAEGWIRAARSDLAAAKLHLAASLKHAVDPILDLSFGTVA
jgi:hypothetical protein